MTRRVLAILLVVSACLGVWALMGAVAAQRLPGDQLGYEPQQPIAFSHRLHAGELEISCHYCHSGAQRSAVAAIPAASTCMNCHQYVTAPLASVRAENKLAEEEGRAPRRVVSSELAKLYAAMGLDENLQVDPQKAAKPLEWVKVHNLPAFVAFDHSRHVGAGVDCQSCHGPIETMDRVRQAADLSMGWCVNCHRDANANGINGKSVAASTDCAACHY